MRVTFIHCFFSNCCSVKNVKSSWSNEIYDSVRCEFNTFFYWVLVQVNITQRYIFQTTTLLNGISQSYLDLQFKVDRYPHFNCWILSFAQISPLKSYLHSTTSMLQIMTSSLMYTMFLGATMTTLCLPESLVNVPKMQEEEIMANAIPRMIPSNGAYCISYCWWWQGIYQRCKIDLLSEKYLLFCTEHAAIKIFDIYSLIISTFDQYDA